MTLQRTGHHISEADIRSAIFRLSNRLRANRTLIYNFDMSTRIILMQVMINPQSAYLKLLHWAKTSDDIPTWEDALRVCADNDVDLQQFARLQKWDVEDIHLLYDRLREIKREIHDSE